MNICILLPAKLPVPSIKGGAIETLIQELIDENEIRENHIDITIISNYDPKAYIISKKYQHTKFAWINYASISYRFINLFIRAIRKLCKVRINNLDIFIINRFFRRNVFDKLIIEGNSSHLMALAKYIDPEKIVFHIHANIIKGENIENNTLVKGCGKIIAVSDFIKKQVLQHSVAKESQVIVLKNCTDIKSFSRNIDNAQKIQIRNSFKIKGKDIVILFTGRIVIEKGIVELLQSLIMLPENLPFKLLVVGSFGSGFGSSNDNALQNKLELISSNIRDKIIFTGFIHNSKLPLLYSISDIAVVPTTIYEEAGPLVPIEAMAAGLPLIISDSGGIPEYVNNKCAIVVKRGNDFVKTLSVTLEKLITDKNLRQAMGIAGKEHSVQYSQKLYYDNFIGSIS